MFLTPEIKPLQVVDHLKVRQIYVDAIESQGAAFYTKEQIKAWASLAWLPGILDRPLIEGKGLISFEKQSIEAFAVRYPCDRLALLYCRGRSTRRGHATALLDSLEKDALEEGITILKTEASCFSYPLLLRRGWTLIASETIEIGGLAFDRYRMKKYL